MITRKKIFVYLLLLNCISFLLLGYLEENSAVSSGVELNWKIPSHSNLFSTPTFVDVNNDWKLDIIVSSRDGVFCATHNGDILWNYTRKFGDFFAPIITDLENDNTKEIIVTSEVLGVICFSLTGELIWNYSKKYIETQPIVGDINNDGFMEILVGTNNDLLCLDFQGSLLWSFSSPVKPSSTITLVDLNNDQEIEILVNCNFDDLYCLFSNGTIFWTIESYRAETAIVDLDLNGIPEILLADSDRIACLNATGAIQWEFLGGGMFHSICAADIMGHATIEVLFCSSIDLSVKCIDWQGNWKWTYFFDDEPGSIAVFAIDTTGIFEVLVSTQYGKLFSLDSSGDLLLEYTYSSNLDAANICIIDLERDGLLEIVFTSNRTLYCLRIIHEPFNTIQHPWYCSQGTVFGTRNIDSDSDLIDDLTESTWFGTDASNPDADGLLDGEEFLVYHTNMSNPDTDGDGFLDGEEVEAGTDPHDAGDNLRIRRQRIIRTILLSFIGIIPFLVVVVINAVNISKRKS
ncbi:MAG: hypothetical protein ACTSXA_04980 [Candidatus Heimdallarchaeota archaeon]